MISPNRCSILVFELEAQPALMKVEVWGRSPAPQSCKKEHAVLTNLTLDMSLKTQPDASLAIARATSLRLHRPPRAPVTLAPSEPCSAGSKRLPRECYHWCSAVLPQGGYRPGHRQYSYRCFDSVRLQTGLHGPALYWY